jgi:hypothetical protein
VEQPAGKGTRQAVFTHTNKRLYGQNPLCCDVIRFRFMSFKYVHYQNRLCLFHPWRDIRIIQTYPQPQFVAVSLTAGGKKHRNMALFTLSVVKLLNSHERTNWQSMNHMRVMVKLDGKTDIGFCAKQKF